MDAMKSAARVGISINDFWDMTPLELSVYVEAKLEEIKQNREDSIMLEYMNAAWQRAKKLPNIKSIIKEPKKQMSDQEMFNVVKALNSAFNGKVVSE